MRSVLLLAGAALAGCEPLPRDPAGTLERVRGSHVFAVGRVAGALPEDAAAWRRVVAEVSRRTGAREAVREGALEPLLLALEAGRLDLVVGGRFDAGTPWKTRVALGPPIAPVETPAGTTQAHVVARNGENAWIMLVERASRASGVVE